MKARIMGFSVDNVTIDEAVSDLLALMESGEAHHVSFVNAHYANVAAKDRNYGSALLEADRLYADGSGMRVAGRMAGVTLSDNVNGTDLFPRLAAAMAEARRRIFLLGGRPGVAQGVSDWLADAAPNLRVCGVRDGYFQQSQVPALVDDIRSAQPHLLLVAMGAPHQDLWIREHLESLGVPVVMAVGGLFDFYSGRIPRAPLWMRRMGMEWVYRLIQEPARLWKRYLVGNLTFLARAFAEAHRRQPAEVGR